MHFCPGRSTDAMNSIRVYFTKFSLRPFLSHSLIISLSLLILYGCSSSKAISGELKNLNGTWIPVREEINGSALPPSYYKKLRLTIKGKKYTAFAESIDKGIVKYADGKMDIYSKEGVNQGKHFTAIYKYDLNELSILYNLAGDHYPETFETKDHELYFLAVFKKEDPD